MPTTDRKGRAQLQPLDAIREGWRSWIVLILVALPETVVVFGFVIAFLITQMAG